MALLEEDKEVHYLLSFTQLIILDNPRRGLTVESIHYPKIVA